MKIKTAKFRVTPEKDGKPTGPEITAEVKFECPETDEEIRGLKGFSVAALASVVSKYLIAHVMQGRVKKRMLAGEDVTVSPIALIFPTENSGASEDKLEKQRRADVRASAERKLAAMDPEKRKSVEARLNKKYVELEIPEGEANVGIFLFAQELYETVYE